MPAGGDEFSILLPSRVTDGHRGCRRPFTADRIRKAVDSESFAPMLFHNLSMGIAEYRLAQPARASGAGWAQREAKNRGHVVAHCSGLPGAASCSG
jgi:GGDEF domain-containing protein